MREQAISVEPRWARLRATPFHAALAAAAADVPPDETLMAIAGHGSTPSSCWSSASNSDLTTMSDESGVPSNT